MNITLLQTDIKWADPVYNRDRVHQLIDSLKQTDLIILPEMFTTGFCLNPKEIAEEANAETLQWMRSIAKDKDVAIAGSVATKENGKYYNRLYFVKPDGSYSTYNKRHLFSYGGEDKEYTAGNEKVVVEHEGFRILLQICYDLRFPVFARNTGNYDMIVYVANWPTTRIEAWNTLLRARAIENQCYVAAVNRTGEDPTCKYSGGGTVLIDYYGKTIATSEPDKEDIVTGNIDIKLLNDFRKKFPALNDADQFRMII
ncbi:amidohydrolase [Dysgonomonas sp. 520]|uniref:amidohydrolase n=1 Tax=Dysgonomonas sp. 520 TaxID=2302931 RepID=UPI0013D85662|nr:amidohydrolase [Dysgonomonas sp. 520]NDW09251.1 amidohydrolase [Dysgonomonas sp. 520]